MILASIQHTGTWFLIDTISKLTGKRIALLKQILTDCEEFEFLHTHITTVNHGIHEKDLLKHLRPVFLDALITTYKTIVPIRDPLAALITRENRHPELNHYYILDSFEYVARMNKANTFLFPIDLYTTYEDRLVLANNLALFLQVKTDTDEIKRIAQDWSPQNTTADTTGLKRMYLQGNYKGIKKVLKDECHFLENKPKIAEFLHTLGYGKFIWESAKVPS